VRFDLKADPEPLRPRKLASCVSQLRYSILPILIGDGVPFFEKLGRDVTLHLTEVKAYNNGMVELRYEVRLDTRRFH
jgi:hypothetical protein